MTRFEHGDNTEDSARPGRIGPPRRSRAGESVSPIRRLARPAGRTHAAAVRRGTGPTPATVWTVERASTDLSADWPLAVVERVVSAFSRAGDRVVLVSPPQPHILPSDTRFAAADAAVGVVNRADRIGVLGDPPALPGRAEPPGLVRPAVPYWADVFAASHPATPTSDTDPRDAATDADEHFDRPDAGQQVADLVIASVSPDIPLDDHFGLACAALLRTGGILAVLTHSDWTRGRLVDPTGSIVALAQNADLLYLQHIVVVHAPVRDGAFALDADSPLAEDEQGGQHRAAVRGLPAPHRRIHTDLLVFAQPRDHNPAALSPATAAFETGVIR